MEITRAAASRRTADLGDGLMKQTPGSRRKSEQVLASLKAPAAKETRRAALDPARSQACFTTGGSLASAMQPLSGASVRRARKDDEARRLRLGLPREAVEQLRRQRGVDREAHQ